MAGYKGKKSQNPYLQIQRLTSKVDSKPGLPLYILALSHK